MKNNIDLPNQSIEDLKEEVFSSFNKLRQSSNLIHCITHSININDMANVILALNQSPIMADHIDEMEDIVKHASALLINIGNIKDYRIGTIRCAMELANKNNIPVVFDMVGIGVSNLRLNFALELISKYKFSILKGNYSEIISLANRKCLTRGVDNECSDKNDIEDALDKMMNLVDATIVATGVEDYIYSVGRKIKVLNGTSKLTNLTGTGCISGAIMASILPITNSFNSSLLALSILGISGERAGRGKLGFGTFHIKLIDEISLMDMHTLKENIKWEPVRE